METIDITFAAVIVALLLFSVQRDEIRRPLAVFGRAAVNGPNDCHPKKDDPHKVICYTKDSENLIALRRFFLLRVILKSLFFLFCSLALLYISLVLVHTVRVEQIAPINVAGRLDSPLVISVTPSQNNGSVYVLEPGKSVLLSRSSAGEVSSYELDHSEGRGRFIWISGDGEQLTELGVSTWFQFIGVLAVLTGIATIAYAAALQHSDD